MVKEKASSIGYRNPDGSIFDAKLHDEIMSGVDDTPHRISSARRSMSVFGLSLEVAEQIFDVTLPDLAGGSQRCD